MIAKDWLIPQHIVLGLAAKSVGDVCEKAAAVLATSTGLEAAHIRQALVKSTESGRIAIGSGVVVPHGDLPNVKQRVALLVQTASSVPYDTPDGTAADLFFVILGRPGDPKGHLLFLAHIARLCEGQKFVEGLRQAKSPEQVLALVSESEEKQGKVAKVPTEPYASQQLVMIKLAGEKALDRLLVDLVDEGLGSGSVLDVQTLDEAVAREVPLFSGFRDLFGDVGGRRLILLFVDDAKAPKIVEMVQEICREEKATEAQVFLFPVRMPWVWQPPEESSKPEGH